MPQLESKIYADYKSYGLRIMAINISDPKLLTCGVKAAQDLTFWVFPDDDADPVWPLYDQYFGIPLNYIIDQEGKVYYWDTGFDEMTLREKLEELLPPDDVQKASFGEVKALKP